MSSAAGCDLHNKGKRLKLHNKCRCQKVITFPPQQYMLERGSIESKLQKFFRGTQTAWNKTVKPAIKATAPFIGMAVSAKTKNPKFGAATSNILKSLTGGRILSLNDKHCKELRLKVL